MPLCDIFWENLSTHEIWWWDGEMAERTKNQKFCTNDTSHRKTSALTHTYHYFCWCFVVVIMRKVWSKMMWTPAAGVSRNNQIKQLFVVSEFVFIFVFNRAKYVCGKYENLLCFRLICYCVEFKSVQLRYAKLAASQKTNCSSVKMLIFRCIHFVLSAFAIRCSQCSRAYESNEHVQSQLYRITHTPYPIPHTPYSVLKSTDYRLPITMFIM